MGGGGLEGAYQATAVVLEGARTWSGEGREKQCWQGCLWGQVLQAGLG